MQGWCADAAALTALAAMGGASLQGLRLAEGALVLKVERRGLGGPGPSCRRVAAWNGGWWAGAGTNGGADRGRLFRRPGPSAGAGSGEGDRELLAALEGSAEGRTLREIAAAVWIFPN